MKPNMTLTACKIGTVLFATATLREPQALHAHHGIYHGHATDHLMVNVAGEAFFLPAYAFAAIAVAFPASNAAVQVYAANLVLN